MGKVKILLITHHELSFAVNEYMSEFVDTRDVLYCLSIKDWQTKAQIKESIMNVVDDIEEWIILTDMKSSIATILSYEFALKNNVTLITGFNIPMIMELVKQIKYNETPIEEIIDKAIVSAKQGIEKITVK